jgi:hypothetical protein
LHRPRGVVNLLLGQLGCFRHWLRLGMPVLRTIRTCVPVQQTVRDIVLLTNSKSSNK